MSKIILAIATAFLTVMTVFASAAEACISCEHVPVVARSSSTSHTPTRSSKKRFYARAKAKANARARARAIAAARAKAKAKAVAAARAKAKAKAVAAAEAAAAEEGELAEANDVENSTIFLDEVAEAETDESEEIAALDEELRCKKFVPEVGITVTVPCE